MKSTWFGALALVLAGCGADNAVVGGHCRDGWSETGGRCVMSVPPASPSSASESTPPPSSSAPAPAPAPSTSAETGGGAASGPCTGSTTDPFNCGACGKLCPSNICVDGECQGEIAGDVIVIGQDYWPASSTSAETKLFVNAMTIPTTEPIRVLAYDGGSPSAARDRSLVSGGMNKRNVAWTTAADEASLDALDLARNYDVILLHAAGIDGASLGTRWSASLHRFAERGGVVIALDDGTTDVPGLVRNANLIAMSGHQSLASSSHVNIVDSADVLGVQVISPFAPFGTTVGFFGVDESANVVARDSGSLALPVAVHRVIASAK